MAERLSTPPGPRPHVVSFYSYKGGVGRTMLAANVAASLARRGRTLLWDLDVEAPGAQFIPALRSTPPARFGFLQWLQTWQERHVIRAGQVTPRTQETTPREFERFLEAVRPTTLDQLYCLPALGDDIDPSPVYQAIDWQWLQRAPEEALALLDALLLRLGQAGFRHVLIDSRTGYTDLGALLIGLLPDITVLVGGYGDQNLRGLARIWRALKKDRPEFAELRKGRPQPLLELVASPIPQREPVLSLEGQKKWAREFELPLKSVVEIPYDPELPFSEKLLVSSEPDRVTAKKYEVVAGILRAHFERREEELLSAERERHHRPGTFSRESSSTSWEATFEDDVAQLLRLLGYRVDQPTESTNGPTPDIVARIRTGLDDLVYVVECKNNLRPLPAAAVRQVAQMRVAFREGRPDVRAMLVARVGFTREAELLAEKEGVRLLTHLQLKEQLLDTTPELSRSIRAYEQGQDSPSYVHLFATDDAGQARIDLLEDGLAWAKGRGSRLRVVQGVPGSGKSSFLRRLAYDMALRAMEDRQLPVPLLVSLAQVHGHGSGPSLEEVLAAHWSRAHDETRDPVLFRYLLAHGRLVVLLDGVDETGGGGGSRGDRVEMIRRLVGVCAERPAEDLGNRVLLTCGPDFLDDEVLTQDPTAREPSVRHLVRELDGQVLTIAPLDDRQLKQMWQAKFGEVPESWEKHLSALRAIDAAALRPGHLRLLRPELLAELPRNGLASATAARLQLAVIERWISAANPGAPDVQRARRWAIGLLAVELWARERPSLHFGDLFNRLRVYRAWPLAADPDVLDALLRTAPFLVRHTDGSYSFDHRATLDLVLAWRLLEVPGDTPTYTLAERLDLPRLPTTVIETLTQLLPRGSAAMGRFDAELRQVLTTDDAGGPVRLAARVNALIVGLAFARRDAGSGASPDRVRQFAQLHLPDQARLANANLSFLDLSCLRLRQADLRGAVLRGCRLRHADLQGSQLDGASLQAARLLGTSLVLASVAFADFTDARVMGADLSDVDARGSTWSGARIAYLSLTHANFEGATFPNARVRDAATRDGLRPAFDGP